MKCLSCLRELDVIFNFCPECGASSSNPVESTSTSSGKKGKKNEKEMLNGGKSSQKQTQQRSQRHDQARKEKVHFHVLLPKGFCINSETDELYIRSGDFGGWSENKHKMDIVRKTDDFVEYHKCILIDTELKTKGFQYKYVVVNGKKLEFERVYFMVKKTSHKDENRHFNIPELSSSHIGEWHQYDGFCYSKYKGFWQGMTEKVICFERDQIIKQNLKTAADYFLNPIIDKMTKEEHDDSSVMMELKEKVEMLLHCLKLQYNGSGRYIDEQAFLEMMYEVVIVRLLDHLKNCVKNNRSLMIAVFIIMLTNQFEMELQFEDQNIIYRNLLVLYDEEEKKCISTDFINSKFDGKEICQQIMKFMAKQKYVENGVCVSTWLYALPLVHFISGDVHPFSKIPIDSNHTRAEWWCHPKFEKRKNSMKYNKWNVNPEEILQDLAPLFAVDYLLPRTFVTSLGVEDVLFLITSKVIPAEICCATLHFHLRNSATCSSQISSKVREER